MVSNLNFIITNPNNGTYVLASTDITPPSTFVSQYEVNKLNVTLVNFDAASVVKFSIKLPDGTEYPDVYLVPDGNNKFSRVLDGEMFENMVVGDYNTLQITNISVIVSGYEYSTEANTVFNIDYFKTNADISYVPTDIENLFIKYHVLNDIVRQITGEDFNPDEYMTEEEINTLIQNNYNTIISYVDNALSNIDYSTLLNKPVYDKLSQFSNDVGYLTESDVADKLTANSMKTLNGISLVKREGESNNIYIAQNIVPAPPVNDGDYTLKCTISNGIPVYRWIED